MGAEHKTHQTLRCAASPSLALVKYWGKWNEGVNVPATTSIAVTLSHLESVAEIRITDRADQECVTVGGVPQDGARYAPFFANLRAEARRDAWFMVDSINSFPTGAGLASSSSAFAALAFGCTRSLGMTLPPEKLSRIARVGSGSAARAVYGGFTRFSAGAELAEPVAAQSHWADLRVVIAVVDCGPKTVSSRSAMNRSADTSVYYSRWIECSEDLAARAERAILDRDIEVLGVAMRQSYLRMFATMFTAEPPVFYWLPETVAVIRACEQLRQQGVPAWETMDAGPQVKILTTADYAYRVCEGIGRVADHGEILVVGVGAAPREIGGTGGAPR
ncbi:MAG: diphosphomevalonate decarboxylase [Spirochaetaceae bacterium]|nr:MAG: diphosphomevalonate decarboxylase [Spirochaetaceae bacterium]